MVVSAVISKSRFGGTCALETYIDDNFLEVV